MSDGLARVLAEGVRERGADVVFGFPGGGPNLEVVGAVGDAGLRFVLTHGETTACMMAATYGLLVGKPGMASTATGSAARRSSPTASRMRNAIDSRINDSISSSSSRR